LINNLVVLETKLFVTSVPESYTVKVSK